MDLYDNAAQNYIYQNGATRPPASSAKPSHPEKSLAMAYILPQPQIGHVFSQSEALKRGTIFPELEKPFLRGGY